VTRDAGPTPPSERIVALDALRGVALLGILLINVWAFAMPETTLFNPTVYADTTVYGDFTGANYWAWAFSHVFAQNKFITLFSALFGAGILLFIESKEEKGQDAVRLHYRRTAILIAIGLMHAYLLWYGDILVAYGVTALVVVAFRNLEARKLAGVGVVFLLFLPVVELFAAITLGGDAIASRSGHRRKPRSNSRSRRTAAAGSNSSTTGSHPRSADRRPATSTGHSGRSVAPCSSGWRCTAGAC